MSIAVDATRMGGITRSTTPEQAAVSRYLTGWQRSVMIVVIAIGLMGIGAIMTYSASMRLDPTPPDTPWFQLRVVRQMVFVVAGLAAMLVTARLPYRMWAAGRGLLAVAALGLSVATSMLVFVPHIGLEVNNAYRWVKLGGGLSFQPSELLKIALPIFLAVWMTRGMSTNDRLPAAVDDSLAPPFRANIREFWRGLLPAIIAIGLAVGVVGIEDFGTAALLAGVGGLMLLIGGARIWHLMLLALPAIPAFGYLLFTRAHRMARVMTFLDIWKDPENKGYQAVQSLSTIVSGGWWGRGLGRGFVKGYLPEARTDFIFAVICEELGLVGAIVVIGLLILLMWQVRMVIRDCVDPMGRLLAFGIGITFGLQAAMNIAVVTVSVPTKGIALPLVSAGGSGVVFLGALIGILASIPRQSNLRAARGRK